MYQGKFSKNASSQRKAPAPKAEPSAEAPAKTEAPAPQELPRSARDRAYERQRRKLAAKKKRGAFLFYSIYLACVLVFLIAILCVMEPLRDWLVRYEASQPGYMKEQVFSQLFEDPDWKEIYSMAGIESNTFENADTFSAFMTQKVGGTELTCVETSAGLSGDKKFIVKLEEEKIASFTLTGGSDSETEIATWQLGEVDVFFTARESVTVEKLPEHTVYINGIALDDSYTVRSVTTLAENYLPEGIHGYRLIQQQVTGLLNPPQVTVKDASGNEVPVTKDPESGIYTLDFTIDTAAQEELDLALNATQTYAKYMIGKATLGEVQKYFDTTSQFYETIRRSEVGWAQSGASYDFTAPSYSEFYRYSDTLFSIKLDMALEQTRFDGSVKTYPLNNTLFFQQNSAGKWLVMEATNVDVQEQKTQVRISFQSDGQLLQTGLIDADASVLVLPNVTAPQGKVFKGWVTESEDGSGKTTLTVVFEAQESNEVYLPSGNLLEPMVLEAYFEEAGA